MGSPQPYSLGGTTNGSVKWPNDSDMYFTVLRGEVWRAVPDLRLGYAKQLTWRGAKRIPVKNAREKKAGHGKKRPHIEFPEH